MCALGAAAPAQAGLLAAEAQGCRAQPTSQVFLPWLDPLNYTLVPGGSFEAGTPGWKLSGGAQIVDGNEPWRVGGAGHTRSLSLPKGSSATSPALCAGLDHLFLRLFTRKTSTSLLGGLLSGLQVDVLYEDGAGNQRSLPLVNVDLGSAWGPTLPIPVVANLLPLLSGQTPLAFRFTPRGSSSWRIDDVYLDPQRRS
jgi:hypothetical protein